MSPSLGFLLCNLYFSQQWQKIRFCVICIFVNYRITFKSRFGIFYNWFAGVWISLVEAEIEDESPDDDQEKNNADDQTDDKPYICGVTRAFGAFGVFGAFGNCCMNKGIGNMYIRFPFKLYSQL